MEQVTLNGSVLLQIISAVVILLLSVNAYFIKSLVEKVDKADRSTNSCELQIIQLNAKIAEFTDFVKEMTDLKSEVAVLKYTIENEIKNRSR